MTEPSRAIEGAKTLSYCCIFPLSLMGSTSTRYNIV